MSDRVFIQCLKERKLTTHRFVGSFIDGGPHEVWECISCTARRVYGAARMVPRVEALRNWRRATPQPLVLSAGQLR